MRYVSGSCGFEIQRITRQEREGAEACHMPSPRPPGSFSRGIRNVLPAGAFGAISSFAFRLRGRPRARMAGMVFCKGDEPAFWPRSDYRWVYRGFLTCTRTAGTRDSRGRTCSRTHRLSCVPEGASFFLAAATAGVRAPLKNMETYAFLEERRVRGHLQK